MQPFNVNLVSLIHTCVHIQGSACNVCRCILVLCDACTYQYMCRCLDVCVDMYVCKYIYEKCMRVCNYAYISASIRQIRNVEKSIFQGYGCSKEFKQCPRNASWLGFTGQSERNLNIVLLKGKKKAYFRSMFKDTEASKHIFYGQYQ